MYDLVDEIRLEEYRQNNKCTYLWQNYERPEKAKWKNKDCQKCGSFFSVGEWLGWKKGVFCNNCGNGLPRPLRGSKK